MPFTPSHAIVALPFVRTPLVPAAIAIGAMTPDLPLFLRGAGVPYGFTHSPANIVWTTLLAFVLFILWRLVLRPGLVALAPEVIASRLPDEWRMTGRAAASDAIGSRDRFGRFLLLVLSLMIGVFSHIVWDMFTHVGRWGVVTFPMLGEMWGPLLGYKWLQYGSSVGGMLILGVYALLWLRRRPVQPRPRRVPGWVSWVWLVSLPVVLITAWLIGLAVYGPITPGFTVQHLAYRTLPAASGLWGALTVLLCAVIVLLPQRTPDDRVEDSRYAADHHSG